jgi:hypothetical protein
MILNDDDLFIYLLIPNQHFFIRARLSTEKFLIKYTGFC